MRQDSRSIQKARHKTGIRTRSISTSDMLGVTVEYSHMTYRLRAGLRKREDPPCSFASRQEVARSNLHDDKVTRYLHHSNYRRVYRQHVRVLVSINTEVFFHARDIGV